jgi:uncharacterized membrane protein
VGTIAEERASLGAVLSAPIVAMGLAMALASLAILPLESLAYDVVWSQLMPLGVAMSLLGAPLDRAAIARSGSVLVAALVGAVGSVAGTALAYWTLGGLLGPHAWKVAACMCSSYVGGTLNFAATARALGLDATPGGQAALAAGMAADNLAMAAFLAFLAAVPAAPPTEATGPPRKNKDDDAASAGSSSSSSSSSSDPALNAPATVSTVGVSFAAALAVLEMGRIVSERLSLAGGALGVVGILAPLVAAFAAWRSRRTEEERWLYGRGASPAPFAGAGAVGGALMLTFFATLGACADPVAALTTGAPTFAFIAAQLATHFCVVAVVARRLMRLPAWAALTASNACVGGPATAAAMASARGWGGAVQPAIVAGTLGYVVGTPVGCVVGNWLKSHMTPLTLPTLF